MESLYGGPRLASRLQGKRSRRKVGEQSRIQIFPSYRLFACDWTKQREPARFELRTYTASPGNLAALQARFRDHTVKLFNKHGMTNIGYWTLMSDQKGADETLVYILAHKSQDAAKAGFAEFGKDPEWQAARKASEEKAGGSLTTKGGVQSLFMQATDYSPIR